MNKITNEENTKLTSFQTSKVALVLTGGGARAAYQAGVLKAISDILPLQKRQNPFPIICGTSAGALNATVVAAYAEHFKVGMRRLESVWGQFSCEQVFHTSFHQMTLNTLNWLKTLFGFTHQSPLGLLNNAPLSGLIDRAIPFPLIQVAINRGKLDALCITASSYNSGESVSFFQAKPDTQPWHRYRRHGREGVITKQHLLASSAIPLVFPAAKVGNQYFGDGSMRFLSPLSPAIHLGASKILVIGVDPEEESQVGGFLPKRHPNIAEISGHLMDSVFIDSLDSDLERLERVNRTVLLMNTRQLKTKLRNIDTLVISPSKDLSDIAQKHFSALPKAVQFYLRRIGVSESSGSSILSYLLFEQPYTTELINLGYKDTQERADEIHDFYKPELDY